MQLMRGRAALFGALQAVALVVVLAGTAQVVLAGDMDCKMEVTATPHPTEPGEWIIAGYPCPTIEMCDTGHGNCVERTVPDTQIKYCMCEGVITSYCAPGYQDDGEGSIWLGGSAWCVIVNCSIPECPFMEWHEGLHDTWHLDCGGCPP